MVSILLILFNYKAISQVNLKTINNENLKLHYCIAVGKFFGNKYYFVIDYGQPLVEHYVINMEYNLRNSDSSMLLQDIAGNVIPFNSGTDFLNYMYRNGWELNATMPPKRFETIQEKGSIKTNGKIVAENCSYFILQRRP